MLVFQNIANKWTNINIIKINTMKEKLIVFNNVQMYGITIL